jgi:hypothetical protein
MIDPASQVQLKEAIADCIGADQGVLDGLREEIRPLKSATRRIQPRATTSISLVGTDGGNNQLQFDPFLIQLVRVVDSSNNEYCLEAVSPTTPVQKLNERQFAADGLARTALGEMMIFLRAGSLPTLSHMIRATDKGKPVSPSWVQVYRELVEWAILFAILKKDFGTDTLIVCDGLLRSKVFAKDLFQRLIQGMKERARPIPRLRRDSPAMLAWVGVPMPSKDMSLFSSKSVGASSRAITRCPGFLALGLHSKPRSIQR